MPVAFTALEAELNVKLKIPAFTSPDRIAERLNEFQETTLHSFKLKQLTRNFDASNIIYIYIYG
jgi:hypothetical protein